VALLGWDRLSAYRALGWSCVGACLILLVLHGKPYYAGPVYPTLVGAGAVVLERKPGLAWVAALLILGYGAVLLPLGVPILPPSQMADYVNATGLTRALRTNTGTVERLPQDYADMLGWEEQVKAMAGVYHSLREDERAQAVIVAGNYGEAGAIDFFGPRHGLPPAVSPVGSYWFFGPGDKPGHVAVTIGIAREDLAPHFDSLHAATLITNEWAVEEEREVPVFVARGPRRTLQEIWPALAGMH
jgi:hypothetical protein